MSPKRGTTRHIIIKMFKAKYKKRILKALREKTTYYIQGNPHNTKRRFFSSNSAGQKREAEIYSKF